MDAFHIDFVLLSLNHADGIEADDLTDGVSNRLVLDMGGDREVLQLVVDKHNLVAACLLLDILQCVAHRRVVEVVGDALRPCGAVHEAAQQYCDSQ